MKFTFQAVTAAVAFMALSSAFAAVPIIEAESDDARKSQSQSAAASTPAPRNVTTELVFQINALQNEVRQLRGQIEQNDYRIRQITERQRELYLDLDRRIQALSGEAPAGNGGSGNVAASAAGDDERAAYNDAFSLLRQRKLVEAKASLEAFLERYPNGELASNAHYWLGQILYNEKNLEGAQDHFSSVINNYADAPKAADALYKLGLVWEAKGNTAEARKAYQSLISKYPDSKAAQDAKARMASLN